MKTFTTTNEILDTIKSRHDWGSDYKLAQELGISRSRLSAYRRKNVNMDDDVVLQAEKLLDLPEGTLLMEMHAIRTKCPTAKGVFHKISAKIAAGALAIMLGISTLYAPMPVEARTNWPIQPEYTLCRISRRSRRVFWTGKNPKLIFLTCLSVFIKNTPDILLWQMKKSLIKNKHLPGFSQ